jgi:hypothetical protein
MRYPASFLPHPCFLVGVLSACGGSEATSTVGPDAAASDAQTAQDANAPVEAESGAFEASAEDADAAASCPDISGQYGVQTSGGGCGSVFGSTSPCIRQGQGSCHVAFQSSAAGGGDGGPAAINGDVQLAPDGSFENGNLTVGTIPRMGCTGSWDSASSTMTVTCGGLDASDGCVMHLKRYASTCA